MIVGGPPATFPPFLVTPWPPRRGRRGPTTVHQKRCKHPPNPPAHGAFLLPRPATAPPNLPSCFPKPVRALFASAGMGLASFAGTGGALPGRPASLPLLSTLSPIFNSPIPNCGPSSASPPYLPALRARSWTLRNFSRSSDHRMMPSSLPFSLGGRSYDEPGVDLRRCQCAASNPAAAERLALEAAGASLPARRGIGGGTRTKPAAGRVGSRWGSRRSAGS